MLNSRTSTAPKKRLKHRKVLKLTVDHYGWIILNQGMVPVVGEVADVASVEVAGVVASIEVDVAEVIGVDAVGVDEVEVDEVGVIGDEVAEGEACLLSKARRLLSDISSLRHYHSFSLTYLIRLTSYGFQWHSTVSLLLYELFQLRLVLRFNSSEFLNGPISRRI